MANKSNKSIYNNAENNKNGLFINPSNVQGIIKYVMAAIGLLLLISLFVNIVTVTKTTDTASFAGYTVVFGAGFVTDILDISQVNGNTALLIAYIVLIAASFASLLDFDNYEWLKRQILPIVFLFSTICFLQVPTSFAVATQTSGTCAFTTVGIVAAILFVLQFVLSVISVVLDHKTDANTDEKKVEITQYIIGGCGLLVLIGLFVGVGSVSVSNAFQTFTGSQLAFGTTLNTVVASISSLPANWVLFAAYVCVVIGIILTVIPIKKFEDFKQWIASACFMFAAYYFWKIPALCFTSASTTAIKSLTAYGNVSAIASTAAVIFSLGIQVIKCERNKVIAYVVALLGVFAISTMFLPIAGTKMVVSGTVYNSNFFKGTEIIFGKPSQAATPWFLAITYLITLFAVITLILPIKHDKYCYLISTVLLLGAAILFVLVPNNTFDILKEESSASYYQGGFGSAGIVGLVATIIAFIGNLYIASTTPLE